MPKRKLSDLAGSSTGGSWISQRLSIKFDHEVQTLARALKVARGFEKQKMGRRGKKARSEGEPGEEKAKEGMLGRLEEENRILKELDMSKTATKYLYKNLSRTKRIAENPTFKQFSETRKITSEAPRNPAEANVLARLFKSNPVKNELPRIMEGFRRLLGVDAQSGGKESASEHKKKDGGMDRSGQNKALGEVKVNDAGVEHAEDEDEDKTMNPNHEGGSDDDDNDEDEDDFTQFDSRLANSDSGSDNELPNPDAMSITPSPRPSPEPAPKKSKPTSTATMAPPTTTTTFLPSLSMGGYISASDSESDPDPENSDSGGKPRRKNRMGQQARRALWEKKYGSGANHVRQENQNKKRDRDSGWDVRRGATSGGGGGEDGKNRGFKERVRDWDTRGQSRSQGQGKDKANDDKPLHPSWEAARKAKEQQQGAVSFKGKKVTFD